MPSPKKIMRKALPDGAVKIAENSYRKGRGLLWQTRYGFPAKGMKIIAITGTNGKTTTASYINAMLQSNGFKTAIYTTAFIEIAGVRTPNRTHMTVSSQAASQKFLAQARKAGVDWVILEITSHALDQGRIEGIKVEVAVVTNLTQEHLDYHRTMERYAAAKARLLNAKYGAKWCILNANDLWYEYFKSQSFGAVLTYGETPGSAIQMTGLQLSANGSELTVLHDAKQTEISTQLIGKFNAYNALAAYGVGTVIGLTPLQIATGIATLQSVPGRMEQVTAGQKFSVVIDFAITPDALTSALTALKAVTAGKVIIVFGATGDRDKTKRAPMGEAVGQLADRIFLTDDETYTEDPAAIREQVYQGIKTVKAQIKTTIVDDRREAIALAFQAAKPNDTVLLTGIGNEDYRNMGGTKEPWDERDVACEELRGII